MTDDTAPWALTGARLADAAEPVDVVVAGGRVVAVGPDAATGPGAVGVALRDGNVVDAAGGLLLPAFVDTHVHLDKVGIRPGLDTARRYPGSANPGDLAWAIAATHEAKRAYTVESVAARATAVVEQHVQHGTTRVRSHVDVDTIGGLTPLLGVQEAARRCADVADVTTIAFPQEGIARDPGAAELMEQAMAAGCDVVGGMPHWEDGEAAQREHVRFCFDLAQRYDADVDMHVDETDDGSVRTLAMVVEETERRGWQGRVTVGHVCALAAADHAYADDVIAAARGPGSPSSPTP